MIGLSGLRDRYYREECDVRQQYRMPLELPPHEYGPLPPIVFVVINEAASRRLGSRQRRILVEQPTEQPVLLDRHMRGCLVVDARDETAGLHQRHQSFEFTAHGLFALVHFHLIEMAHHA